MRNKIYTVLLFLSGVLATACSETDYPTFDDSVIDIYFTTDSLDYSFGIMPLEQKEYTFNVPVQIIGAPVKADRNFAVEVVSEGTDAEASLHYRLPESGLTLPADSIHGILPVTVLRDNLGEKSWKLKVRLTATPDFNPTPQHDPKISHTVTLTFNNIISKPNWVYAWNGESAWPTSQLGPWNPTVYIVFMDFFHRLEDIVPESYHNLVEKYGENLDNRFEGWDYNYDYTFKKHILVPMYQYFQDHPELGVTDFPNPLK